MNIAKIENKEVFYDLCSERKKTSDRFLCLGKGTIKIENGITSKTEPTGWFYKRR